MSTFAERVEALAREIGISYPLLERDLHIASIAFSDKEIIFALPCTTSFRMFIEALVRNEFGEACYQINGIAITDTVEQATRVFFGEHLWNDRPDTGVHPIIDGIKRVHDVGGRLRITWKHPRARGV